MKMRIFNYTILLKVILFVHFSYADDSLETHKNVELSSSQLLGCNPLKGLKTFAILPQYSVASSEMRTKINEEIATELKKIGKIVTLEAPNVTGFGNSEARLTLQIKDVVMPNLDKIAFVHSSLSLATSTVIKKTGTECTTYIWSIDAFSDGKNFQSTLLTIKNLVRQFIEEYQAVNSKEKPIFYLYTL